MENLENALIKMADLSKIDLKPEEKDRYQKDFEKILEYFNQIQEVDVGNIPPLICPVPVEISWREDQVMVDNERDALLLNAPEKQGHLFVVPPVL